MLFFNDPFFWAFISMFGLVGCGEITMNELADQTEKFRLLSLYRQK